MTTPLPLKHFCPATTSKFKATRPEFITCEVCFHVWTYTARDWPPRKESHDPARD